MDTNAAYLASKTVVELRAIAKDMGLKGYSRERKADLVLMITMQLNILHGEAIDMDAVIDEAYQGAAETAGITIPTYLACQKAHTLRGEIRISGFWNCPREKMTKAVVFDNGQKQAVTPADASFYSGQTLDMPETGHDEVCSTCGETYFIESTVSEGIDPRAFDSMNALKVMIAAMKPLADKALAACEATSSGPVRDMHYQTYQDMTRAMGEMMRSLAYWDEVPEHVCSFQREVGMSGCSYGCKIYRCEGCGEDREIHNATYGCKG